MSYHPHHTGSFPLLLCTCREHQAERVALWQGLSPAKRKLLAGLAHGPRTWTDIRINQGVRSSTIQTAIVAGLVTVRDLRAGPLLCDPLRPFLTPTPLGTVLTDAGQRHDRKAA